MQPILNIFRIVAPEFADVSGETVLQWIELTAPFVSKKRFKTLYTQALALLTAHRMKLAGLSPADIAKGVTVESAGGGSAVSSFSEGGMSISFNTPNPLDADSELVLTQYGSQYLRVRNLCVIGILSAGEGPNSPEVNL